MPKEKSSAQLIAELYAEGHPSGPKCKSDSYLTDGIEASLSRERRVFFILTLIWFIVLVWASIRFISSGVDWLEMAGFDLIMAIIWIKKYFDFRHRENLWRFIEKLQDGIVSSLRH